MIMIPDKSGFLGCRLETMNVFDGKRKVIFEKPDRFEAPNWMPDGKKLLFNMDGFFTRYLSKAEYLKS